MPSGPFGNRTGEGWTYTGSGSGPNMPTASNASYTTASNQVSSWNLMPGNAGAGGPVINLKE
jgi:hypothetical protein